LERDSKVKREKNDDKGVGSSGGAGN